MYKSYRLIISSPFGETTINVDLNEKEVELIIDIHDSIAMQNGQNNIQIAEL